MGGDHCSFEGDFDIHCWVLHTEPERFAFQWPTLVPCLYIVAFSKALIVSCSILPQYLNWLRGKNFLTQNKISVCLLDDFKYVFYFLEDNPRRPLEHGMLFQIDCTNISTGAWVDSRLALIHSILQIFLRLSIVI